MARVKVWVCASEKKGRVDDEWEEKAQEEREMKFKGKITWGNKVTHQKSRGLGLFNVYQRREGPE